MNKLDLIDIISSENGKSKADAQRLIDGMIEITQRTLKKGEPLRLVGFGTFQKAKRSARTARNPKTGAEVQIKAHFIPRFKPGQEFKDRLKG